MHQHHKQVAGRHRKRTAGREGQCKGALSPGPSAQDVGAWTLLGEYCGVWDRSEALDVRTAEDPLGLGTLRQDRVVELGYTTSDARPGVDKGQHPLFVVPPSLEGRLLPCCRELLGCTLGEGDVLASTRPGALGNL